MTNVGVNPDDVRDRVRERYGNFARQGEAVSGVTETRNSGCCGGSGGSSGCGGSSAATATSASTGGATAGTSTSTRAAAPTGAAGQKSCCGTGGGIADMVGYNAEDLAKLPAGADMGLSCGNPTALASLKSGEVVLDLGSGGGFDAFIAGPKVGSKGRVIGVDMTPEMISKARRNLGAYRANSGLDNVEFRLGEIEHLPIPDQSVDVVISNCVLNLSPDKPQVWREIARVLKPGGRVAISDLALFKPLPDAVRDMIEALVGCVAGAALVTDIEKMVREAGLVEIALTPKPDYVGSMDDSQDPLYRQIAAALPVGSTPADYVTSLDISARKR